MAASKTTLLSSGSAPFGPHKSPDLKVLLERCTDQSLHVSLECCMSLVNLVEEGKTELDYVLTQFLNILPIASVKSSVLQGITSLLVYQVNVLKRQYGAYHCPYGIRNHLHPYITILTNHPSYGMILLDQVQLLLERIYNSTNLDLDSILHLLKPFLAFVLGDPRSVTSHYVKFKLQAILLQSVAQEISKDETSEESTIPCNKILEFLVSMMSFYKIDNKDVEHTSSLMRQVIQWILDHHKDLLSFSVIPELVAKLVDHLLTVILTQLRNNCDFMTSLLLLQKVQGYFPEVFIKARTIWTLNVLLVESPSFYLHHLLSLWREIICKSSSSWELRTASLGALIPLLKILSSPATSSTPFTSLDGIKELASKCFVELDAFNELKNKLSIYESKEAMGIAEHAGITGQLLIQMETYANVADRLMRNSQSASLWLSTVRSTLCSYTNVPSSVSLLLGMLLTKSGDNTSDGLDIVKLLVKISPEQSLWFLPVFLCKLSQEPDSSLKLKVLYAIPDLATHKMYVGPVLKTIQSLSLSPSLRSIAIRLLLKLWRLQNRVFPHLQKVLLSDDQDIRDMDVYMEIQIAKAASIRDICLEKPSQHGPDLLALLSTLIDKNVHNNDAKDRVLVVGLALDGIKHLCEAEVVDLCTAWKVLSPKLSSDTRPVVVKALCELFSLVPKLAINTQEYKNFKAEAVSFLWKTTQHEVPLVAMAAFSALSHYDSDEFKLCHLPDRISKPIIAKILLTKKTTIEEDLEDYENSVSLSSPPGWVYMALADGLHQDALPGYEKLLTSIIKQESSSIPRGVVHNATRADQSHSRSLMGIPSFLEAQYERSKTPGLNTGLAVGLLFSYEPPFEEHEGKRARRYHLNCARSYKHMLDSLLHEVPIQPSEWHRNMLLPQAWTLFMTRLYHASVLGRKEEISMQFSRGHIQDKTEAEEKQNNAWLWTRDNLLEQLQSASRGNPSVQGNSVLALAGLAVAVSTYASQQSNTDQSNQSYGSDERQRTREWLCIVADTLMVVLDGNYKARTAPFTWCQQVSSPTSTASSLLARACAALSLSQMVPVLVTLDPDRIKAFNDALKLKVPGQAKAGSSSVVQVHCSLGLGLLLSKLYEEHFSELAGNEGYMMMTTSLDVLETAAFSQELENTEGASLGVGVALSSLCKENIVDSRVHLLTMHQKLKGLLHTYNKEPNQTLQTLSFSFSLVTANAFHTGIITGEEANQCVHILKDLCSKCNEAVGVSLSLGLLLHALLIGGHANVTEVVMQQLQIWETYIDSKDFSSLQKLAGVNGIMGLIGSEQGFFQVDGTTADLETAFQGKTAGMVKRLKNLISSPEDVGLASHIAWLLGHVYAAATSSPITRTSVPGNYSYLPDTSILRAVFDFLIEAGKTGPHLQFSSNVINHVLIALVTGPNGMLPPVNWASVLGPVMRSSFGEETSRRCLQFAVLQAKSSSSLMSFLSSWLTTGLFSGLQTVCQKELFQSLSKLIFVVPSARIQEFLKGPVINCFDHVKDPRLCESILSGLLSALQVSEPPPSVYGWISTSANQIYQMLTKHSNDTQANNVLRLIADCLGQNSLEQINELTQYPSHISVPVRCHLVSSGKAPIKWFNTCITRLLNPTIEVSPDQILWNILKALFIIKDTKHHYTDERLAWFMDVISQIRLAATNEQQPDRQIESLKRGLKLLSGVAMCFSNSQTALNLDGLPFNTNLPGSICCELSHAIDRDMDKLARLLPCNLIDLIRIEEWSNISDKVLEWLFAMRGSPRIQGNHSLKLDLDECIVAFKDAESFKAMTIWTEALSRTQEIICIKQ